MIVRHLAIALLLVCTSSHAQNLVPNGDFEAHGDCSNGPWAVGAEGWIGPDCLIKPLYFNDCATPDFDGEDVPSNVYGLQWPHSGDGYIGCRTFLHPFGNGERYATVELDSTLTTGTEYCVRFWISLGDTSDVRTNTLHAYLTNVVPIACASRDTAWASFAQITFDASVADTSSWTLMEGSFVAAGNEKFLTLGNMLHGLDIYGDTTFVNDNGAPIICAMYFDDVYLGPCDVGVQEEAQPASMRVYPNPAVEVLYVQIAQERVGVGAQLEIFDALGRVHRSEQMNGSVKSLDLSALSTGIYWLRVLAEGRTLTAKFSKE